MDPEEKLVDDIISQTGMKPQQEDTAPGGGEDGHDEQADTTAGGEEGGDGQGDEGQPDRGGKPAAAAGDKPGAKPAAKPQGQPAPKGGQPRPQHDPNHPAARRVDFEKRKIQNDLVTVTQDRDRLKIENDAFRSANTTMQKHNINAEEMETALEYFANWKRDPIGTVKELLTEMKASGMNIESILPGSVDTAAIQQLIRSELGTRLDPIQQRQQAADQEVETRQAATRSVDEFCEDFPEALPFLDLCAAVMEGAPEAYPNLRAAWSAVEPSLLRRGIDPQKVTYEEARKFLQGDGNAQPQTKQPAQRKPIPQGNRQVNGGGQDQSRPAAEVELASENDSYESIVKSAMRQHGLKANF